jgi:outer membrane receptor for ferrienterochelin and colicin
MMRGRAMARTLLVLLLLGQDSFAGTTGILEGTVRDSRTGERIPGVSVSLTALRLGAATDNSGAFSIQNIRVGTYEVRFAHVGYRQTTLRNVIINPDLRTRITVGLEPVDVQLDEVVVTQEKPLIQTDVTATAFTTHEQQLQVMPVSQPLEVLQYKPGVTIEGSIRGGKPTEVAYLVDGLPVKDLLHGDVMSNLPLGSVVGLTVYTGGFDAEYGNALSGVVNLVTRQGGDTHTIFTRIASDHLFGGTQVSKATEGEVTLSGPLLTDRLFYVGAGSFSLSDTRWWQDLDEFFSGPIEKKFNGIGKLDYTASSSLRLGLNVLYSMHSLRPYEYSWRYNLNGLPPEERWSSRLGGTVTHTLSPSFFYTANLSWYHLSSTIGDRNQTVHPLLYEYDFFLRYVVSGTRPQWMENLQNIYTIKVDGTLQPGADHLLKFGFEYTQHDLRAEIGKLEPRRTYFGKPLVNEPPLDFGSAYSYRPRTGAIYVQDKIDLLKDGLLVNLGLRYDFLDPRASRPALESSVVNDTAYVQAVGPSQPASIKQQLSPRIGAATPVFDKGYVFFNLGWYFQYPLFEYLYSGLDRVALAKGVSAITGNPNLEPERSMSMEWSFRYPLPHDVVVSLSYFKRETSNLVDTKTFLPGDSKVAGDFGFAEFVNNPFAVASGFEVVFTRDRGEWVTGEISYTYLKSEGMSGSAYDGFFIAQYGLPPVRTTYPLSWDQTHTIKALVNLQLPEDFGLMVNGQWHTGRPYTRYPSSTGFEPVNAGVFALNNDRMPEYLLVDLRAEKHFRFSSSSSSRLTVFVDIRNLTNQQNVVWMDSNSRIGGELNDPSGYAIGRRTRLGIQFTM